MVYFVFWTALYVLSYNLSQRMNPAVTPYAVLICAALLLIWLGCRRSLKQFHICRPVLRGRDGLQSAARGQFPDRVLSLLGLAALPAANLLSGGSFAEGNTAVLMAGAVIFEEVFFRGVLLAESGTSPFITWIAAKPEIVRAGISSGLFAVFHAVNAAGGEAWLHVLPQMICAFCAGMLFAAVTLRTDSLIPAAAGHYFVNMTAAEENVFSLPVAAGSAICLLAGILLLSRPRERKADRG